MVEKNTTKQSEMKPAKPAKEAPKLKGEIKDSDLDKVAGGRIVTLS